MDVEQNYVVQVTNFSFPNTDQQINKVGNLHKLYITAINLQPHLKSYFSCKKVIVTPHLKPKDQQHLSWCLPKPQKSNKSHKKYPNIIQTTSYNNKLQISNPNLKPIRSSILYICTYTRSQREEILEKSTYSFENIIHAQIALGNSKSKTKF